MKNDATRLGTMPMGKLLISTSVPLMFSLLVQSLYNIIDGSYVSRYSQDAFTATTVAFPIFMLMIAMSVGISVGINALLSRLLGQKKFEEVNEAATTGIIISFLSSMLFALAAVLFLRPIVNFLTTDENIASLAYDYLKICMCFSFGQFLGCVFQRFLQSTGRSFLSMICLVVGAVTNIILDPIFIFKLNMGIKGAAISTVIGQILDLLVAIILCVIYNKEVKPMIKGFKFKVRNALNIFQVGLPTILTQAMGSVMSFFMSRMLIGVSTSAVAVFGAYHKLTNFMQMPMNGLGQAGIAIIGYNYGALNKKRIKKYLKLALVSAVSVALISTILFNVIPETLLGIFNAKGEMLEMGIRALHIISIIFPLSAITTVLGFSCAGLGNGVVNTIGTGLRQVVVLLPMFYILLGLYGISNAWYAYWVSEAVAVSVTAFIFIKIYKKRMKEIDDKILDYKNE